jgi:hypothetical protein
VVLLLVVSVRARAQEPPPTPPPAPPEEERSTGLPKKDAWTFNLDASIGAFGFGNSLYRNVRPDPPGDLSDNWFEGYVKPAISASFALGKSELYGKISVVGARTYGAAPSLVGEDASSFMPEDLHVGWRSGTALGTSENLLELTVGGWSTRSAGFLVGRGRRGQPRLLDERRKAAVRRDQPIKPEPARAFYLDRTSPGERDRRRMWGASCELMGELDLRGARRPTPTRISCPGGTG